MNLLEPAKPYPPPDTPTGPDVAREGEKSSSMGSNPVEVLGDGGCVAVALLKLDVFSSVFLCE